MEKIASYYGVSSQNTIAVGDSLNDLPMIQHAGLGIAVKNADDTLKSNAKLVCDFSNNENAIGEIIRRYALANE